MLNFRVVLLAGAALGAAPAGAAALRAHVHHVAVPPALPGGEGAAVSRKHWRPYSGAPIDVLTYHYDALRTGWNPSETDLTPQAVGSASFQKLTTLQVDGNVLAQPLLVSGYAFPDGSTHDVLIVATGHNSVYAFDAQSYAVLWQVSLGPAQSSNDVGCGDVVPEYGISSTPVIVRSGAGSATIYVVSAVEPNAGEFHTYLNALDLGTGNVRQSVEIKPSARAHGGTVTFQPQNQWSRAGLALSNNSIYVGIGSHCDQTNASGWLLRYDTSLNLQAAFHTEAPSDLDLGSIWMTGFAPAIGPAGNVFAVTGNGDFQQIKGARSLAMSALSFTPTLSGVASSFTPANYQSLSDNDEDFGSGGIMLLPPVGGGAPPLAVTIGKWGQLYLLNQNRLGGLTQNDTGPLDQTNIGGGVWGGPSFYGSPNGPIVYVQGDGGVLNGYPVSVAKHPRFGTPVQGTSNAGYGGALMAISSNGGASGTGVVWLARRGATVQLEAYEALGLGNPIFAANAGVWSNTNNNNPFVSPLEANGRVYVPAYKTVTVFGLTQ